MQKDRGAFFCEGVSPKIVRGTGRIFGAGKRGRKLMQKAQNSGGVFLTVHILAAVAQHEREIISARTSAALKAAKARGKRLGNYSKHGLTDQPDRRLLAVIAVSTEDTWASHPENNMTAYENRLFDSSHRRIFFCDPRNLVGRRLLSLKSGLWRPRPPPLLGKSSKLA
jgi:predicted metalloprotease